MSQLNLTSGILSPSTPSATTSAGKAVGILGQSAASAVGSAQVQGTNSGAVTSAIGEVSPSFAGVLTALTSDQNTLPVQSQQKELTQQIAKGNPQLQAPQIQGVQNQLPAPTLEANTVIQQPTVSLVSDEISNLQQRLTSAFPTKLQEVDTPVTENTELLDSSGLVSTEAIIELDDIAVAEQLLNKTSNDNQGEANLEEISVPSATTVDTQELPTTPPVFATTELSPETPEAELALRSSGIPLPVVESINEAAPVSAFPSLEKNTSSLPPAPASVPPLTSPLKDTNGAESPPLTSTPKPVDTPQTPQQTAGLITQLSVTGQAPINIEAAPTLTPQQVQPAQQQQASSTPIQSAGDTTIAQQSLTTARPLEGAPVQVQTPFAQQLQPALQGQQQAAPGFDNNSTQAHPVGEARPQQAQPQAQTQSLTGAQATPATPDLLKSLSGLVAGQQAATQRPITNTPRTTSPVNTIAPTATTDATLVQQTQLSNAQQANLSVSQQLAKGEQLEQSTPRPTASSTPVTHSRSTDTSPLLTAGQQQSAPAQPLNAQTAQSPAFNAYLAAQENGLADQTLSNLNTQLSRQVKAGQDHFKLQLHPSELGRIDVRLSTDLSGITTAKILVENADTLDLMARDIKSLERSLQTTGLKLSSDGIELGYKDSSQQASSDPRSGADQQRAGADTRGGEGRHSSGQQSSFADDSSSRGQRFTNELTGEGTENAQQSLADADQNVTEKLANLMRTGNTSQLDISV